ncbi:hypothetical protein BKA70DRAFT_1113318, partial [Coprinopsis sp. MPI-PUGE-AT-0042]
KLGPGVNDLPNQPIRDTVIAPAAAVVQVDKAAPTAAAWSPVGAITESSPPAKSKRADRRAYDMVFSGTGRDSDDRDASIEGTAYLTHTLVSNATYEGGLEECLAWCDGIEGCVFVNLYHEFNNFILDFVAQEKSNLKCAAYGEVYGPTQKTNWGGQQSYKAPAPLIYIQESSGYAVVHKPGGEEPAVPEGYELVWGPISRAGYDDGLLDYAILDQYDTDVCSSICNAYVPDQSIAEGMDGVGVCGFINIWKGVLVGEGGELAFVGYVCALYAFTLPIEGAIYEGEDDYLIMQSRGYRRINYISDPSFEEYPCDGSFCYSASYSQWVGISAQNGYLGATIFHYEPYARTGVTVALLGSGTGADSFPGTLVHLKSLDTKAGETYRVGFWQDSTFGGVGRAEGAWVDLMWNGEVVESWKPGFTRWTFLSAVVEAKGGDIIAIRGGAAPSWTFIDDVGIWIA